MDHSDSGGHGIAISHAVGAGEVLAALVCEGIAEHLGGERYRMTPHGKRSVQVCVEVALPRRVARPRDIKADQMNVWELICLLDMKKFRHVVVERQSKQPPFDPAKPETKCWTSTPRSSEAREEESLTRLYLVALAIGDHIVPHGRSSAFYEQLLAGKDYKPRESRQRRQKLQFMCQDEEVFLKLFLKYVKIIKTISFCTLEFQAAM